MRPIRPIRLLASILLIGLMVIEQEALAQPKPPGSSASGGSGGYEIWITNQSKDAVQIIDGPTLKVVAEIPMDDDGQPATSKPHTITFSPDGRYAYVANVGAKTGKNNVSVIRTADRKVAAAIPAGPGAHMVAASTDGRRAFVANAGGDSIVEILADPIKGEFKTGRTIVIEGPGGGRHSHPTCLLFSKDSKRLYLTGAGPSDGDPARSGFLAVMEVATGKELARIPDLGREACVQAISRVGDRVYLTIGGEVSRYAVLDTETNQFAAQPSAGGRDPHGLALTPGEHQIWIANRMSNHLTVFSPSTLAHIRTHFIVGDRPDLLVFSPDGLRIFATLRGQPATPIPGDLTGSEPGLVLIETDTGKVLSKLRLEGDPHGIAILSR